MNPSHLPPECDPHILLWSNQGLSWRAIEQKLLDEQGIKTTYRSVGRRLTVLRTGRARMLDSMEREVWAMLSQNLSELDHAEDQLATITELAMNGDEARGIKPDLRTAMRVGIRHAELILNKHRFYQTALTEMRERTLAEAEEGLDEASLPFHNGRETVQSVVPRPEAPSEAVPRTVETVRETVGETPSPAEESPAPHAPDAGPVDTAGAAHETAAPVTPSAPAVRPQVRSEVPHSYGRQERSRRSPSPAGFRH
jgi:hypothetical protein